MKQSTTTDNKTDNKNEKDAKNYGKAPVSLLIWVAIWALASFAVKNTLLLPGPTDVIKAFAGLCAQEEFYLSILATLLRCVFSAVISFFIGAVLAYFGDKFAAVRTLVHIPVTFFKAVPVMAVAIYIILLAESNWVGVIACVLMCFPIAYSNIIEGLRALDGNLLEVCKIYGISGVKFLRYMQIPSVLPQIKSAINLIAGISWKAVIAAEVLSIPRHSLGTRMLNAKIYLETSELFAYICVIVALSLIFEKLTKAWVAKLEIRAYKGSKLLSGAVETSQDSKGIQDNKENEAGKYIERDRKNNCGSNKSFVGAVETSQDSQGIQNIQNIQNNQDIQKNQGTAVLKREEGQLEGKAAKMKRSVGSNTYINVAPEVILSNIEKSFEGKKVLSEFNMRLAPGKVTALCGESGCGKTTVARLIAGLDKPDEGTVHIEPKTSVAVLFQEERLFPWLNVFDNIAAGVLCELGNTGNTGNTSNTDKAPQSGCFTVTVCENAFEPQAEVTPTEERNKIHARSGETPSSANSEKKYELQDEVTPTANRPKTSALQTESVYVARVKALAKKLEIEDVLWDLPSELSGGMQHRVSLARTLAAGRGLMVLDEPFRGLNKELKNRIINRLWREETAEKTVLLITHSTEDGQNLADKTVTI